MRNHPLMAVTGKTCLKYITPTNETQMANMASPNRITPILRQISYLGSIWEAFGSSLRALWAALWELGRPWGLQGHLGQKMMQIHYVLQHT